MKRIAKKRHPVVLGLAGLALMSLLPAGCASPDGPNLPAAVPEIAPGILQGYLASESLPDSLALIPPPPAEGSAAFARDQEASRKGLTQHGTPRWDQAVKDADLAFPAAADAFTQALGFEAVPSPVRGFRRITQRIITPGPVRSCGTTSRSVRRKTRRGSARMDPIPPDTPPSVGRGH